MSDGRCWLAWTEWITEEAWKRIADKPEAIDKMLEAVRSSVLEQLPDGWYPDNKAHHGPLHPDSEGRIGVTMVMRAWRPAPTESRTCDGTCEMCSRNRSSYVMTGVTHNQEGRD